MATQCFIAYIAVLILLMNVKIIAPWPRRKSDRYHCFLSRGYERLSWFKRYIRRCATDIVPIVNLVVIVVGFKVDFEVILKVTSLRWFLYSSLPVFSPTWSLSSPYSSWVLLLYSLFSNIVTFMAILSSFWSSLVSSHSSSVCAQRQFYMSLMRNCSL